MHVGENFDRAKEILNIALNANASISYSQFGEDLLIDIFFIGRSTPGFYVDIGAHHPERFSNTHLLYTKGWRGINVDGDPALIEAFRSARPQDVNVTAFISNKVETATFSRFSDNAVNTISNDKAAAYSHNWTMLSQTVVTTRTLADVLEAHLPVDRQIDLLSVDVEGFDLQVLQGSDWTRYRPSLVIVEVDDLDLMSARGHPIVDFMAEQGYRLFGYVHVSAFFAKSR